jgi:signal transduction histidine kinase
MVASPVLFSIIPTFILIGAGIMALSVFKTHHLLKLIKSSSHIKIWRLLFYLMIFFLLGYLLAFYLFIQKLTNFILVLTGIVLLFGAIFVFISVNLYYLTVKILIQNQTEIREYSQKLENTLQDFQHSQSQLIHKEKMLSLGQMVAGIAHEINNPVTFIHGNIEHLDNHINILLYLLQLYQQDFPTPTPRIKKIISEHELEFVKEDLPKLFLSMKTGTERIREIVKLLRTFSRMDEAEIKTVDIHTGIDSTIMILEHRLQAKPEHQKIRIIRQYAKIPLVECYAGELNQVFLHLLTNAIDALEEKNNNSSYQEIVNNPNIITISTAINSYQQLEISISDNGNGIPESVQKNIFEPFYTTKPIGKGTGLGLSISHEIISKHRGTVDFVSNLGQGTKFMITIPIHLN